MEIKFGIPVTEEEWNRMCDCEKISAVVAIANYSLNLIKSTSLLQMEGYDGSKYGMKYLLNSMMGREYNRDEETVKTIGNKIYQRLIDNNASRSQSVKISDKVDEPKKIEKIELK